MNWTTTADFRIQVKKLWDRGEFLCYLVNGELKFPLRLSLRGPDSSEITKRFSDVREWISELFTNPYLRIEMRLVTHRVQGENNVPQSVWVDSLKDALSMIGKQREAASFQSILNATLKVQPKLIDWLAKRPMRALELADEWERLLNVVTWIQSHSRPGIYIRQVDLPGIHTKFIENYRAVLTELLDRVLPSESIDLTATGASHFAARYGFREKPERIRFRVLDNKKSMVFGLIQSDITLDIESFIQLELPVDRVFITENEINFLVFPPMEKSLVIFGAGYGWDALAKTKWLTRCSIHYWGDIDTHGFAILDQLRSHFAQVRSFLMDRETLMLHEALWGIESEPVQHDLQRLTESERSLFNDLRDNRFRKNLRMEQERVGFKWVETALQKV